MASHVIDLSSNAPENIARAAEIIGPRGARRDVFIAIYTGKQKIKTARELAKTVGLTQKRVTELAKRLAVSNVVTQLKVKGYTAYQKNDWFHDNKAKILSIASSKSKLKAYPTKRNPARSGSNQEFKVNLTFKLPRKKARATHLTIDDINNFSKVRKVGSQDDVKIGETKFKNGVAAIVGEHDSFKDWGGESRDLSTTRLLIDNKRRIAAFAFKGPGKTGRLTPGKMGKNGDQIQRLVRCPAEVFIVQYWSQIDDSVLEQLQQLVTLKAYLEDKQLWYGIINGNDSARLIMAYPKQF
jgi:hypothetical protein